MTNKGRPRTDKLCTRVNICINNEINEAAEHFGARQFIKGYDLKKAESVEQYFEMVHEFYKKNNNK